MSIFFERTPYHIFNNTYTQKPNELVESKSDRMIDLEICNKNIHNFQTAGSICLPLVSNLYSNQSWNKKFERSTKKPILDKSIKEERFRPVG